MASTPPLARRSPNSRAPAMSDNLVRLVRTRSVLALSPPEIRLMALFCLSLDVTDAETVFERIDKLEVMQAAIREAMATDDYAHELAKRALSDGSAATTNGNSGTTTTPD